VCQNTPDRRVFSRPPVRIARQDVDASISPGITPRPGQWAETLASPGIGERLHAFAAEIFPICRSITGDGVRETLGHIERIVPLQRTEVPSGTQVLDWTVPQEWTIRDAWVKNSAGERVIDFRAHSLHVLNYSVPIHTRMQLNELKQNIFTLPDQPDLIPYRTSYYQERWGFCMSHNALQALPDGEYEVVIDSDLKPGSLTYAEHVHAGESSEEILLQAHICHPSLANDNCSGIALLAHLAAAMQPLKTKYTYRFLFAPGTIGAITWLERNREAARRVKHGLVLSCVGDAGGPTYKRTWRGEAAIDRAMTQVLRHAAPSANVIDFFPYGYDERQYNSPGFRLDVGLFQRSQFATFPEYHTSGDNLDFIRPEHLEGSLRMIAQAIEVLECDACYRNMSPEGEPQLGRRGLYATIGGDKDSYAKNMAMLWLLNMSDGDHSLLDIAQRADLPFAAIAAMAEILKGNGLLAPAS
jgi:aminopeptidase-like protein